MEILPRPDVQLLGSPESQRAAWVSHQPNRTEPLLLFTTKGGVFVGAFDRRQLCGDCYVIAYRMNRESTKKSMVMAIAKIGPNEVSGWR
jgi:hypothetical protein